MITNTHLCFNLFFNGHCCPPKNSSLFLLLDSKVAGHADTLLQKRFHDLGLGTQAFSSVQYVGTQTITPPTDYSRLLEAVKQQVKNTHTRSPRQPGIVFHALEVSAGRSGILDEFNGEITNVLLDVSLVISTPILFPSQFFPPSSFFGFLFMFP